MEGGAVHALKSGSLTIQHNSFERVNLLKPMGRGGAIFLNEKRAFPLSVIGNTFKECSADLSGAIHWVHR